MHPPMTSGATARETHIRPPGAYQGVVHVSAKRIQAEALRRGLILELGGRHNSTVRFLPPLIIAAEQVDAVATIFAEAVEAAERDGCGAPTA